MLFALHCIDKPHSAALRVKMRVPHLAYTQDRQHHFRFGGPLLNEAGKPEGSLMILEFPDLAALHVHMQGDPFFRLGLFETVAIHATRQVMPEAAPGALVLELATATALAAPAQEAT